MANWKKTVDELPKDGIKVSIMTSWKEIDCCHWDSSWERWFGRKFIFKPEEVIAWCPIPEYDLKD